MSAGAGSIYAGFHKRFPKATDGALRIWWVPQIPGRHFEWPVASPQEAKLLLTALSAYDDFQFAVRVKGDYSNAGGLNVFRNGDWEEWESDDGEDIDTWKATP